MTEYHFVDLPKQAKMIPLNYLRVGPFGFNIPLWMQESIQQKGFTRLKILVDIPNRAILIKPTIDKYGGRNPKSHTVKSKKAFRTFKIRTAILVACEWSDLYKGWIVDLNKKEPPHP